MQGIEEARGTGSVRGGGSGHPGAGVAAGRTRDAAGHAFASSVLRAGWMLALAVGLTADAADASLAGDTIAAEVI